MISINTNLQSLITQNNLTQSTNGLDRAIERLTTGFKINHAKDNAANVSISNNMSGKITSYQVAEDNTLMALDMVNTASESLNLIEERFARMRMLQEQALNGTYGEQSLDAINAEVNALADEIERLYVSSEFNNLSLFRVDKELIPPTPEIAKLSDTMMELGLYKNSSLKLNNGNEVEVLLSDTVSSVVSKLKIAGLDASFVDGVFYLGKDDDNVYISEIDDALYEAMGLTDEPDAYIEVVVAKENTSSNSLTYTENRTVGVSVSSTEGFTCTDTITTSTTTGLKVSSTSAFTSETSTLKTVGQAATSSSAFTYIANVGYHTSEYKVIPDGYSGYQFVVKDTNGNVVRTLLVSSMIDEYGSLGTVLSEAEAYGISFSFNNGVISYYTENGYYLDNGVSGGSELSFMYYDIIDYWQLSNSTPGQAGVTVTGKKLTYTATADTTNSLSQIGLTSNGSITLSNGSVVSVKTSDTVSTVVNNLKNAGLSASFSDGKFTLGANDSGVYITDMTSDLKSKLGLSGATFSKESGSVTTTTYGSSSTMGEIGLGSNNQKITLSNGNVVTVGTSTKISDVVIALQNAGLTANYTDGKFELGANGSTTYISNISSDLKTAMRLSGDFSQTSTTTTTTTASATGTTTMQKLGLTSSGSITLSNGQSVSIDVSDSISKVVSTLKTAGLSASFKDGKITLGANDSGVYITNLSTDLSTAMKLGNSNYSQLKTFTIHASDSTLMSTIGLTTDNTITLNNGNSVDIKITDKISDVVSKFRTAGIDARFSSGKLILGKNGSDVFIENMGSDFAGVAKFAGSDFSQHKSVIGRAEAFIEQGFIQGDAPSITMQIGINSESSSQITFDTSFDLGNLNTLRRIGGSVGINCLDAIDMMQNSILKKQTELGSIQNRLESVLEEISIKYENLVSSRSTIRDADVAKESSAYIRNQILQNASATLLATANQTPSIALQLI